MIDSKLLRENPEKLRNAMRDRGVDVDVDELIGLDSQYRSTLQKLENARAEQNKASLSSEAVSDIDNLKKLKRNIQSTEIELEEIKIKLSSQFASLPNIPLSDTPVGQDESSNVLMREVGEKPVFDFEPKHYMDIAEGLGIIDIESAGKVSGSRFGYILGGGALIQFALLQYAMSRLTDHSFIAGLIKEYNLSISGAPFVPVIPPVMIRDKMMRAMGFVERAGSVQGSDEMYWLPKDELYLVGTSEQSIGPMHYDEILDLSQLPIRYVGYSTCFRREAGASGKDTRGILRVHQFNKIEMFSFTVPEVSEQEHLLLLAIEETLMKGLGLHYRVMHLSTGDMGAASASTYDIETWMPGQKEYRETHSTSNTTDYQSRSLRTRYRNKDGSASLVHMLNGTVFSERPMIAILEQFQTVEGAVHIPEVLQPFMNGIKELSRKS